VVKLIVFIYPFPFFAMLMGTNILPFLPIFGMCSESEFF